MRRTALVCGAVFAAALFNIPTDARVVINDAARMNSIAVEAVVAPTSVSQISSLVRSHKGPVCIGGARYSQGGQIATANCLFLDMRRMNRILSLDSTRRIITVEAGATWRQIQEAIDPHQLSLKIMQSYSNFTVGGSLSVNAHGRYVGEGPIVNAVLSIVVVTADGTIVRASRSENRDIFDGVIGGYGGLGVIVQATLELVPNTRVERSARSMPARDYRAYFLGQVLPRRDAVFHSATLYPPGFTRVSAVTWSLTQKQPTVSDRLASRDPPSRMQKFLFNWLSDGPFGKQIREFAYDPLVYSHAAVEWRNYEASDDIESLDSGAHPGVGYALQEYFVPASHFDDFVPKMARVFAGANVNVLNISIRYALADRETLLAWAPADMFSFVIYYRQGMSAPELAASDRWTGQLIESALSEGGTFYLPYRIVASRQEFLHAYKRAPEFFALKARLDPEYKFRNRLWDAYYRR